MSDDVIRWRLPETAPKDGRRVLLAFCYRPNDWDVVHTVMAVWGKCHWYVAGQPYPPEYCWLWMDQDSGEYGEEPDGWLPAPLPPAS